MGVEPIHYSGGTVARLERQEETDNRFVRVPEWLALVAVSDYPGDEQKVFKCMGTATASWAWAAGKQRWA